MTEEIEASQSGIEDGGMGGPGAPTPLSALEVRSFSPYEVDESKVVPGGGRPYKKRHSVDS